MINGTAYPDVEVDPKSYRFRILNAASDRFWNFSCTWPTQPWST